MEKIEICEICGKSHSAEKHREIIEMILKAGRDPENIQKAEKRGPATLDIVRIDGRWAQVVSSQINEEDETTLVWLADKSNGNVNLRKDYKLKQFYGSHAGILIPLFSKEEFINIHWASGENHLRGEVKVFGEYESESDK